MYVAGLDLGQSRDYTALAVVEATPTQHAYTVPTTRMGLPADDRQVLLDGPPVALALVGLERYELGTRYTEIARHVAGRLRALRGGVLLAIDATGVGRGVVDLFAELGVPHVAVTITGGVEAHGEGADWRVPKRDLVHALLVAFQSERFTYAKRLALAERFVAELEGFQLKISLQTGHDSYEAWREGAHDDLVLAVSLCTWLAEREYEARLAAALADLEAQAFAAELGGVRMPTY